MSKRFRITYRDPETGEQAQHIGEYADTPGVVAFGDGSTRDVGTVTAREWAEDHAYSLADKGPYQVEEIRRRP